MTDLESPAAERLDAALAKLPRTLPPARDLWPAIAAEIAPARFTTGRMMWRIAAGAAFAAIATFALWRAGNNAPGEQTLAGTNLDAASTLRQASFETLDDPGYAETRDALVETYHERLQLLTPATRSRIERNLSIIRRAKDDIRRALVDDPASPTLQRLLESTRRQEIDLYQAVGRNTEPAVRRTRT